MHTEYSPNPVSQLSDLLNHLVPDVTLPETILPRLLQALNDGHSYIYVNQEEKEILEQAAPIVGIAHVAPLVLQGQKLFSGRFWQIEKQLAEHIHRLSHAPCSLPNQQICQYLEEWFKNKGSEDQQAAAALTLLKKFILISGGPGAGKTTTVAKLLGLLCLEQSDFLPRIVLAAPTGKAAVRMSEALSQAVQHIENLPETTSNYLISLSGQTIHRLLKITPPSMQAQFNESNPLPIDILLLDEASMLDSYLLLQVLKALPTGCRLILLGDDQQLPSVGVGATVAALCQSEALSKNTENQLQSILPRHHYPTLQEHAAQLTISHRFNADSAIGHLARHVAHGHAETAWQQFEHFPEQLTHKQGNAHIQAVALYQIQQSYWHAIQKNDIEQAFHQHSQMMVLSAHHKEAEQLNHAYRQLLQTYGIDAEQKWFAGQVIMIIRNDFTQNLFNGDIGIILPKDGKLFAWFHEGNNTFRPIYVSRLPEHETAFAITVHKSQGSEYNTIWLLAPETEQGFNRALLYTAITRAKNQFCYWGDYAHFQAACQQQELRRSALSDFIKKANQKTK